MGGRAQCPEHTLNIIARFLSGTSPRRNGSSTQSRRAEAARPDSHPQTGPYAVKGTGLECDGLGYEVLGALKHTSDIAHTYRKHGLNIVSNMVKHGQTWSNIPRPSRLESAVESPRSAITGYYEGTPHIVPVAII